MSDNVYQINSDVNALPLFRVELHLTAEELDEFFKGEWSETVQLYHRIHVPYDQD